MWARAAAAFGACNTVVPLGYSRSSKLGGIAGAARGDDIVHACVLRPVGRSPSLCTAVLVYLSQPTCAKTRQWRVRAPATRLRHEPSAAIVQGWGYHRIVRASSPTATVCAQTDVDSCRVESCRFAPMHTAAFATPQSATSCLDAYIAGVDSSRASSRVGYAQSTGTARSQPGHRGTLPRVPDSAL